MLVIVSWKTQLSRKKHNQSSSKTQATFSQNLLHSNLTDVTAIIRQRAETTFAQGDRHQAESNPLAEYSRLDLWHNQARVWVRTVLCILQIQFSIRRQTSFIAWAALQAGAAFSLRGRGQFSFSHNFVLEDFLAEDTELSFAWTKLHYEILLAGVKQFDTEYCASGLRFSSSVRYRAFAKCSKLRHNWVRFEVS